MPTILDTTLLASMASEGMREAIAIIEAYSRDAESTRCAAT